MLSHMPTWLQQASATAGALVVILGVLGAIFRPHVVRLLVRSMRTERALWLEGLEEILAPTTKRLSAVEESTARTARQQQDMEREVEHRLRRIEENGADILREVTRLADAGNIQAIELARLQVKSETKSAPGRLHGA